MRSVRDILILAHEQHEMSTNATRAVASFTRITFCCIILVLLFWSRIQAAGYQMEVRLDPARKLITGTALMTWTNSTVFASPDLRFHLYYNAWRDTKSSFLKSNRMLVRDFRDWGKDDWAYNEILSLKVLPEPGFQEADLTSLIEYIQPNDGNPHDRTVMRVVLPQPVPPGGTMRLKIDFRTKVPRTFARTGFRGDYFFLAHWFPKLGVFQEDGAWNCHQFIQTEFFADYGAYDVKMTVPRDWIVGATGLPRGRRENSDGTATHHYYQENVHDFAWVASPDFLEFRERFEHPSLKPVEMRLLLMPDHQGQERRYFAATRAALRYYGEWFGEYPYGHITVIDPAYQSGSGGMEYPTFFTGGTRWLNPEGSGSPEGVTVHECGHQFWYGIIGNNEFEDAWLDEGFNSYSTRRVMLEVFGPAPLSRRYLEGFVPVLFEGMLQSNWPAAGLGGFYSDLKLDVMAKPSWQYGPAARRGGGPEEGRARGARAYGPGAYTINSYTKPSLMLLTLERYLGWQTFQKIMSTYFSRWRFKHPRPKDYFDVANEITGRDLSWFWEQTYYSSNVFDYAVDSVTSSEDEIQSVVLRRWGEGIFPVEVEVTFTDATVKRERWDGRSRWIRYEYQKKQKIRTVRVDPDGKLALDVNSTNNSWNRNSSAPFAARKWALKWMIWLQNLMELFAFFC